MSVKDKKRFLTEGKHLMMGNVAMSEGAIAAGLNFFGGYPITPSTEVIEHLARRLPEVGGCCMQMEDELASINSVVGAALAGAKAMTATSGPGLSLMTETISMAANLEVPFVFCDVQRNGPGTGYVTEPHHNDMGLMRFAGNGEFQVIALAPMTCQELFDLSITAFNFAEQYRCPIFIVSDAYLGHLHEVVKIPPKEEILDRVIKRELPEEITGRVYSFLDKTSGEYDIPKPPIMGTEYCPGLFIHQPHGPDGLPTPKPMDFIEMMIDKVKSNIDKISLTESYLLEDAEIIIVAYGLPVRASYRAVDIARKEGIKVGIFRLITVWPFPDEKVKEVVKDADAIIVPELNYTGFIAEQVERVTHLETPVIRIPKVCEFHHPDEILKKIKEVVK
ncbi:MAG: 2-oxoacid:acceptor oxidoreductase subunit alpha [Candidatus Lokiarchaeota archaeon]|nr:2-oxoacid:acceptor oxidoreductase subunit alpha [Candidatus Lokiarchaeota archaeon]MBD3340298.1 2-oxoacid:acceptor oxidoreductase subunit alpha [Candidatus Lokiarchaeota archaeon]